MNRRRLAGLLAVICKCNPELPEISHYAYHLYGMTKTVRPGCLGFYLQSRVSVNPLEGIECGHF